MLTNRYGQLKNNWKAKFLHLLQRIKISQKFQRYAKLFSHRVLIIPNIFNTWNAIFWHLGNLNTGYKSKCKIYFKDGNFLKSLNSLYPTSSLHRVCALCIRHNHREKYMYPCIQFSRNIYERVGWNIFFGEYKHLSRVI